MQWKKYILKTIQFWWFGLVHFVLFVFSRFEIFVFFFFFSFSQNICSVFWRYIVHIVVIFSKILLYQWKYYTYYSKVWHIMLLALIQTSSHDVSTSYLVVKKNKKMVICFPWPNHHFSVSKLLVKISPTTPKKAL